MMMEAPASPRPKKQKVQKKVENRRSTSAAVADKTESPSITPEVPEQADLGQRIIRLKQWLSSHSCLTFSVLLLVKILMWIFLIWIMSHLHLGLPCFLVVLVKALYDGPLQKGLEWAMKKMQRKKRATHGETHK